jgi:uncharacterized membrane protein
MKNVLALLVVLCIIQTADASFLTFMSTPYDTLDKFIMPIWKPLVNLILISWAQNIICGSYVDLILDAISATTDMTSAESKAYCETGISSFMDAYFYGGSIENKPTSFGWSWNPTMDFN